MFLLLNELADRFIEFVLRSVNGGSVEDKLTSAIKSCGLLIAVLGSMSVWLGVGYFNLLVDTRDLEGNLQRVNGLFVSEGPNSLSVFVGLNEKLNEENDKVKVENLLLLNNVIILAEENKWLKGRLDRTLEVNEAVKKEYKELLQLCIPVIKNYNKGN